jgi:hypothetical protein
MSWSRKLKIRISSGLILIFPWRRVGSLAHHHTPGLTPIGTLILILILIPTLILSNTRIYLIRHTPTVMFASPISRPCPVFVRKVRLRVRFLYQASELFFSPSL